MQNPLPLSLYIHLPWCIRKCPYCDFNSHALKKTLPEEHYLQALIADFDQQVNDIQGREIKSIFFGGGTPSLFSSNILEKLLLHVKSSIKFHPQIEITLEANPGTVDVEHFAGYRAIGINRISLGVQSFQTDKLKALGRIHDSDAAISAFHIAKQVGFDNINLDLMHGLPKQSIDDAWHDLETAFSLQPTHLSWYQLTLEPNTLFAHAPPPLPQEELLDTIYFSGQKKIQQRGYQQYEISAYCQEGYRCQHNLNYWQFGDYLGIGAGAHSKLTDSQTQTIKRIIKIKHPETYLAVLDKNEKNFILEEKTVDKKEAAFEFMLNALRLYEKIPFSLLRERTFLSKEEIMKTLEQAAQENLLWMDEHYFSTTEQGKKFLNQLLQIFL